MRQTPTPTPATPDPTPDPSPSGGLEDQATTYQELLDEALSQTFPASDPIAPGAAASARRPISSGKNPTDWKLEPGSSLPCPARPDLQGVPGSTDAPDAAAD